MGGSPPHDVTYGDGRVWHVRAVLQRARDASVTVEGARVGGFAGPGIVALIGVTHADTPAIAARLADKIHGLRIFEARHAPDEVCLAPGSPRELSAGDLHLPVLVISQFTLYADTRKGRRPTWDNAAPGDVAAPLVDDVVHALRALGTDVSTGIFGADMQVSLTNDGPITIILDVD